VDEGKNRRLFGEKTVMHIFLFVKTFLEDLCFRPKIGDYLEENAPEDCLLEDKLLARYAKILDIVNRESTRSCCFTKAYSHYYIGMDW
jgi:hypothetical protein